MIDAEVEELARLSLLEEELSVLRHDLRNRLNGIRNGAFYIRRKSESTPLWESDQRIGTFFDLIEDEIGKGEAALAAQASIDHILPRQLESGLLEVGVMRGLDALDVPGHVTLETDFDQAEPTPVWAAEVALLAR